MNAIVFLFRLLVLISFVGMLASCAYTDYPPRIDFEFKPGAPVASNGTKFVQDPKTKRSFSQADVSEQLAFINQTLMELQVTSISPKLSQAQNRRYSAFLQERLFTIDLESVLTRLRVSTLLQSVEWVQPQTAMSTTAMAPAAKSGD
jgi:hypothetical protein